MQARNAAIIEVIMPRKMTLLVGLLLFSSKAGATPGRGDDADSAIVNAGSFDLSIMYDRLHGGPSGGEDVLQAGITHGLSDRLRIGAQASFAHEPGAARYAETAGAEALLSLGKIAGIDAAVYGTYDFGIDRPDAIEARLILQHVRGPIDLRFNLIGAKDLAPGETFKLGYAFGADYQLDHRWTLGLRGFGEFGSFDRLLPHGGHAAGPSFAYAISPAVNLRAGYLFTMGNARADADGQFRIGLEFGL